MPLFSHTHYWYEVGMLIEEERLLIERIWQTASREPSDTAPGLQLSRIVCTQKHSIYNSVLSLYRHSRRHLESPWVGPINAAAVKRLKLTTVTPGATSTLSASSASLFLYRCSDSYSSSFTHAAINLKPPSRTVLY